MPDPKIYTYQGDNVEITYDLKRCIHAAECVRGLPAVFNPNRKPWIEPDAAPADTVARVIERCPTGALHYTRTDEGSPESVPEDNTASVVANGPLYLHGDIEVKNAEGETILHDTRVALCRCGLSSNKPFCDNSHKDGFSADASLGQIKVDEAEADGPVTITCAANGPLLVRGPLTLHGSNYSAACSKTALCRCGLSSNKPLCDGSHRAAGFQAE
ncbi:MAG: CDGSH iron-sulfur domain-containing protein [Rhodothermales bacterium]